MRFVRAKHSGKRLDSVHPSRYGRVRSSSWRTMIFARRRLKKWNGHDPGKCTIALSCRDKWIAADNNKSGLHEGLVDPRKWRECVLKMIALSLFIWTIARSRDRSEIENRDSRRDSLYGRDRADSRRNSRETATIGLTIVDRRRHRPRRHSRRYYVDRNKRWVSRWFRETTEFGEIPIRTDVATAESITTESMVESGLEGNARGIACFFNLLISRIRLIKELNNGTHDFSLFTVVLSSCESTRLSRGRLAAL